MSAISCSASSILLAPVLTRTPSSRLTQLWSNTASMATMPSSSLLMGARSRSSSTPAVRAASRALAEIGSQPPKTRSSSAASGTKSLNQRIATLAAAAEADVGHLGEGADRSLLRAASGQDTGDDRRRHRPEAGSSTPSLPVAGAI